jgi:hypothetical protein
MLKKNEKMRICIDFIDLNKACKKDPFPLPRIDTSVDRARYQASSACYSSARYGSARYTNELEAQLGSAHLVAQDGSFGSQANLNFFHPVKVIHLAKDKDEY